MRGQHSLYAFNRGLISDLALARVDLKKLAMAASTQTNWMPRKLGSMMLRPGLQHIISTRDDEATRMLPFVFAADDSAIVELTDGYMRAVVDDVAVTRGSVSTAVTNGTFTTDLSGWTDADEGSAASVWVTGGYMGLTGTGTSAAIRRQTLTVSAGDLNDRHALRIVIQRGPVTFRLGSTSGGDEYITEATLGTGTHSLAFTPTAASVYVQFGSRLERQVLVDSIAIEAAGVMTVPTPWLEADLDYVRGGLESQSADVVFVACRGYQQRRIERRASDSWSVVLHQPEDGPFRLVNAGPGEMTPSAITGNVTLTASIPTFRSGHVGALWSITSVGQLVTDSFTADNDFSGHIRVASIGDARKFSIILSNTFVATLTLQRSVTEPGSWEDVTTYTTAGTTTYDDNLDNQIIYYRIGIKTGGYTSGTADVQLVYASGSITGVARITAYSSSTSVSAEVLTDLGGTDASSVWNEGAWSDYRGWPTAVCLHEGRLWWAGQDRFRASVTDVFDSHDPEYEGDAGPISRSIGSGPVDSINWLVPIGRLMAGTDGAIVSCNSTSFDEVLTPTNFKPRVPVSLGSSSTVQAEKVDNRLFFVHRSGTRLFELMYALDQQDYITTEATAFVPALCSAGVARMAVQRVPDTRVHVVLDDGTVACYLYDSIEELRCWVLVETDGDIEDVCVLPGATEDAVYYTVKRTINGSDVRFLEKWAHESAGIGGAANRLADSWVSTTSVAGVVTGLSRLEGESVIVWGDSRDLGSYTVASGSITLDENISVAVIVGLAYTARFKSTKLAYVIDPGHSALMAPKHVAQIGLILKNTHAQGVQYGQDFDTMYDLPLWGQSGENDADAVLTDIDEQAFAFGGMWNTDARLCLKATAPRPCTVLAAVIDMNTNPKG